MQRKFENTRYGRLDKAIRPLRVKYAKAVAKAAKKAGFRLASFDANFAVPEIACGQLEILGEMLTLAAKKHRRTP